MKKIYGFSPFITLAFLFLTQPTWIGNNNGNKNCEHSINSEVSFKIERRKVIGDAFSNVRSSAVNHDLSTYSKGGLEICSGSKNSCKWDFNAIDGTSYSINTPGFEEIIRVLDVSKKEGGLSIGSLLAENKKAGADIKVLATGTLYVSRFNPDLGTTIVTLIDTNRGVILGSSIYKENDALQSKIICKYKTVNAKNIIDSISVIVYDYELGEREGWLTEATAVYP